MKTVRFLVAIGEFYKVGTLLVVPAAVADWLIEHWFAVVYTGDPDENVTGRPKPWNDQPLRVGR